MSLWKAHWIPKNLCFVLEVCFKRQISNLKDNLCSVPQSADLSTCGPDVENAMPCHKHLCMPPCSRLWAPQKALSSFSLSHGLVWLLPVTWKLFATQGPQRPGDTRTNNSGHSSFKAYFLLCLCVFIIAPKPPERQRQAVSTFKLSPDLPCLYKLQEHPWPRKGPTLYTRSSWWPQPYPRWSFQRPGGLWKSEIY